MLSLDFVLHYSIMLSSWRVIWWCLFFLRQKLRLGFTLRLISDDNVSNLVNGTRWKETLLMLMMEITICMSKKVTSWISQWCCLRKPKPAHQRHRNVPMNERKVLQHPWDFAIKRQLWKIWVNNILALSQFNLFYAIEQWKFIGESMSADGTKSITCDRARLGIGSLFNVRNGFLWSFLASGLDKDSLCESMLYGSSGLMNCDG